MSMQGAPTVVPISLPSSRRIGRRTGRPFNRHFEPLEYRRFLTASLVSVASSGSDNFVADPLGNLYGTNGNNQVIEIKSGSTAETPIATLGAGFVVFNRNANAVSVDAAGNIYVAGTGTVLWKGSLTPASYVEKVDAKTHAVSTTNCVFPQGATYPYIAGIVVDTSGNIYGVNTNDGQTADGTEGFGTIWELALGAPFPSTLIQFGGKNGFTPNSIHLDRSGNLYGSTFSGGTDYVGANVGQNRGAGTIWTLSAGSNNQLNSLATIPAATVGSGVCGVIQDNSGNYYGTTQNGPAQAAGGALFKLAAGSSTATLITAFTTGSNPYSIVGNYGGTPLVDGAGDIFGTLSDTASAGIPNSGAQVWEVVAGSKKLTTVVAIPGQNVYAQSLAVDLTGDLYFTSYVGNGLNQTSSVQEVVNSGYIVAVTAQVGFATTTGTVVENATLSPIVVNVEDASGNTVITDSSTVTLAIKSGPGSAVLSGTLTATAVNGVATFSGLSLNIPGTYILTASDGTLKSANSNSFIVTVKASTNQMLTAQLRLYLAQTNEHLYTTDFNEYTVLQTRGWQQEGVVDQVYNQAATVGGIASEPYYRLYNPSILQHLWTTDAHEYSVLAGRGWNQEGIVAYIFASQVANSIPLYRLNLNTPTTDLHLWTTDEHEYSTLASQFNWTQEGIIGYVLTQTA